MPNVAQKVAILGGGVLYSQKILSLFSTEDAAPILPYTMEPGPGTLTGVDTNNIMSVSGGRFRWNGTPVANNRIVTALHDHIAGRAWGWEIPVRNTVTTRLWYGVFTGAANLNLGKYSMRYTAANTVRVCAGGATLFDYTLGVNEHEFVSLDRDSGGGLFFGRNGLSGNYTLLWVYPTGTSQGLWQIGQLESADANDIYLDNLRLVDYLITPYTQRWGLATAQVSTPANNEIINANADHLIEITWTPQAAETLNVLFRRTDDNNCWIVRCDQAASRIYLYEKVVGVETERGATGGIATTFTPATAYRIVIRSNGDTIRTWVNTTSKHTYTAASFNISTTGAKVTGLGTATDFAAWPLSVALPAPFDVLSLPESSNLARVSERTLGWANITHDWAARPVLAELASGRWIASYFTADGHNIDTTARFHVRFSDDEGVTWSDEDELPNGTAVTGMPLAPQVATKAIVEPGIILCPNGDLLIHGFERAGGGTSQWRSTDDGATWTYDGLIADTTATLATTTIVASDDAKVVGSTIYELARVDPGSDFLHPHYLALLTSADNGATWQFASWIEPSLDINEAGLLHIGGNVLHAIVKDTGNLATYRYVSTDLGATWGAREYITNQLSIMNKPRCKTIGGYHWVYGRDVRSSNRTVIYRSSDGVTWDARFYPSATIYTDTGYCDLLQRADGDFYMLDYGGTITAAQIQEYVFEVL